MLGLLAVAVMATGGPPSTPETPLRRLLEALEEAEEAEGALERARMAFAMGPTPQRLARVREASRWAFEKEVAFQALWNEALATWTGPAPRLR